MRSECSSVLIRAPAVLTGYGRSCHLLTAFLTAPHLLFLRKFTREQFCEGCEDDTCCICMDEFTPKQRLLVMPCKHRYHPHCLKSW